MFDKKYSRLDVAIKHEINKCYKQFQEGLITVDEFAERIHFLRIKYDHIWLHICKKELGK